jgi:hypothetical protein
LGPEATSPGNVDAAGDEAVPSTSSIGRLPDLVTLELPGPAMPTAEFLVLR